MCVCVYRLNPIRPRRGPDGPLGLQSTAGQQGQVRPYLFSVLTIQETHKLTIPAPFSSVFVVVPTNPTVSLFLPCRADSRARGRTGKVASRLKIASYRRP